MLRRSVPILLSALATAALCPPLAGAAAQLEVEQFNRATGTAGAFGLTDGYPSNRIGGVTDNGRYVFFSVRKPSFPGADVWIRDSVPGEGLWVRDIVRNTTTRVSSDGGGTFTGIDRTSHAISFITSEPLDRAADTNGKPDLYAYEPLTGVKLLVSRGNGPRAAAVGLTSFGTVTRGTTTAIFGTADGIYRRELLSGRNTKVGTGNFIAPLSADLLFPVIQTTADQYVSDDAKVFTTDSGVVTPAGVKPLPTNEIDQPVRPFVNESGSRLVWQASYQTLSLVRFMNVGTGAITAPPIPAGVTNDFGVVHRPTPDGTGVLFGALDIVGGDYIQTSKKWNFTTGALTTLGDLAYLSRNEQYGLTGDRSGALLVGAVAGNHLPGTVDLPSAIAYIDYNDGCQYDELGNPIRLLQVSPERNAKLPLATTARFQASAGAGQPIVLDKTVAVPTDDGYHEELLVELPFADGAFRLTVTITLADGRTIVSKVDHGPRAVPDGC